MVTDPRTYKRIGEDLKFYLGASTEARKAKKLRAFGGQQSWGSTTNETGSTQRRQALAQVQSLQPLDYFQRQ